MSFPCEITIQAEQPAVAVHFRAPVQELPQHFKRAYALIGEYLMEAGVDHEGPVYAAYYGTYQDMDMQNLDVEAGFALSEPLPGKAEVQPSKVAGGTFAVCHYTGPYDAMPPVYEALTRFVGDQGHMLNEAVPIYEWYFNGPEQVRPKDLRTDIAMPVLPLEETAAP